MDLSLDDDSAVSVIRKVTETEVGDNEQLGSGALQLPYLFSKRTVPGGSSSCFAVAMKNHKVGDYAADA